MVSVYRFHDLALTSEPAELESRAGLGPLCRSMGWRRVPSDPADVSARVSLRLHDGGSRVPAAAVSRFRTEASQMSEPPASVPPPTVPGPDSCRTVP